MFSEKTNTYIHYCIIGIWLCNCIIGSIIAIRQSWLPHLSAGTTEYSTVKSDPFDGTMMPIRYIPDWSKPQYQNKSIQFLNIPIQDYVALPGYDAMSLSDIGGTSKSSLILHYTYITPYMGSYRLNYKEYDGSHNAVDIRAPIGTPVLAIANGVVTKTIEADTTGNKYIVIRHDNVPWNGTITTLYSCYLHLSEISIKEGTTIKKGEMIGKVGMTGIATTPHLHIQIDTMDAPFHPYWPFNSSDSRAAGLSFFDSVDAGLGKQNAMRYNIHPMQFINMYQGGYNSSSYTITPVSTNTQVSNIPSGEKQTITEGKPINDSLENIVASMNSAPSSPALAKANPIIADTTNRGGCTKKRFDDISSSTKVGKIIYRLVDEQCMFQGISQFSPGASITKKEAIIMLMQFYHIEPSNGTSHFLDIPIGDGFQGYALMGYKKGILEGNYAYPDKILSKEDFIELAAKIGKFEKNTSQIKIYSDVGPMNLKFQYIQDYAFKIRAKGGKFNPQTILTKGGAVEILGTLYKK